MRNPHDQSSPSDAVILAIAAMMLGGAVYVLMI